VVGRTEHDVFFRAMHQLVTGYGGWWMGLWWRGWTANTSLISVTSDRQIEAGPISESAKL
jgi:hypothetical protein